VTLLVGQKIPKAILKTMGAKDPEEVITTDLFAQKKTVLFAVPGAYTPTCSAKHLPGYVAKAADFKARSVDLVACLSVNDVFVMDAWGRDQKAGDAVMMLADGSAAFTQALGLGIDLTAAGFGIRSKRYAMVIEDCVVTALEIEESPGILDVSAADRVLLKL